MQEDRRIRAFQPSDLVRLHEIRTEAYEPIFGAFRKIVGDVIADIAITSAEKSQKMYLKQLICQ